MGDDSLASGVPTFPTTYDVDTVSNMPTLSLVIIADPLAPSNISINTSTTTTTDDTTTGDDTTGGVITI